MGLSRRAYAKHRGVSEMAVRKAISAGRISVEPDDTIDPVKADAQWARNTGARSGAILKPIPASAAEAVAETLRESGEPQMSQGQMTYASARTANEIVKAQERRVRLQKLRGELVDRSKATTAVFALARKERDAWLQWPSRCSALMAAELQADPHKMQQVLEAYVRQHLAELAGVELELR
jgi:hypothetical protein